MDKDSAAWHTGEGPGGAAAEEEEAVGAAPPEGQEPEHVPLRRGRGGGRGVRGDGRGDPTTGEAHAVGPRLNRGAGAGTGVGTLTCSTLQTTQDSGQRTKAAACG